MKSMEKINADMKRGMNPDASIGLIAIGSHAWFDFSGPIRSIRRKRNEYL